MNLMTHHRVRHIPVLRDGRLAGIISIGDVVKQRLDDLELETNVLRDAYNAALTHRRARVSRCCSNLNDGQLVRGMFARADELIE
jgi:CBS domain-containing protein